MIALSAPITDLLRGAGDAAQAQPVEFAQLYQQLHAMARHQLNAEGNFCTLNPTALVSEAWLRLGPENTQFSHRRHFFAAASQAMRRILVDHARARLANKRGSGAAKVELDQSWPSDLPGPEELTSLDGLLAQLESLDAELARVVCLRCFGGFTVAEIAEIDEVTERTVFRHWATARSWLDAELRAGEASAA